MRKGSFVALLLSPALLLVGLVSFYPMAHAVYVSFHKTRYLELEAFAALDNFTALARDPGVVRSVSVTLKYVLGSLGLALSLGMLLALTLNRPLRFGGLFRTIVLLPWVLSQVVTALLWTWLLEPSYGPVNYLLNEMGIGKVFFLASPMAALPTLIWTNVWASYPLATVLILAALQTVPLELYEAARIDGAGAWDRFTRITLPLISSTVLVAAIVLTLFYFNMVTLILVLTGGGPLERTETLGLRVFYEAFQNFRVGRATALAVVILLCNVVFSVTYVKILRRETG